MHNTDTAQRPHCTNILFMGFHDLRRKRHWKRELSVVATSQLMNHHSMQKASPLPRYRRSKFSTRTRHLAIICAYHLHRKSKLSVKYRLVTRHLAFTFLTLRLNQAFHQYLAHSHNLRKRTLVYTLSTLLWGVGKVGPLNPTLS